MKVLFIGRTGLLEIGGGDKIQIQETAKEIEKLGVTVDFHYGTSYDPSKYDLIHIFQVDWVPPEFFYNAKTAKQANKPLVVSPIHHKVEEVKKFDDKFVFDYRRISKFLFKDQYKRDTFKNVYRAISDKRVRKPVILSILKGFRNLQRETLKMADKVLVQTHAETRDLEKELGISLAQKSHKVVNGVGEQFMDSSKFKNPLNIKDYIISVGRIEPRKNQLTNIEAIRQLREETGQDLKYVIIGRFIGKKHMEYSMKFKKALKKNPWVIHIEKVPYEDMPSYYHYAKVCISTSWFESTGLTSLEALYCGTNAVASGEQPKEYLGDHASYCEPDDIKSIKNAIKKELGAPRPLIDDKMKEAYTWKNAAAETVKVYKELLNK